MSIKQRAEELEERARRLAAAAPEMRRRKEERLRLIEQSIMENVDRLDARLKSFEERLAQLEQRVNSPVGGLKR